MVLNIYNKTKNKLPLNKEKIKKMIELITGDLKTDNNFELTLLIVSPGEIKRLNKNFRHQDKITDVLSFSQREGGKLVLPATEKNYLGDIIICYSQAKKQSSKFNHSLAEEFSLLTIHGFLHLLGYDDKTDREYRVMAKIQNKILKKIYVEK